MAVVNELVSRFSFVGDLSPQREFNENLKVSIIGLAGVATGLLAATAGVFAWAGSVLESIDPLAQLSRETGVAVENIQALGYAASVNGSSLDAVSGSLRELGKRAGEFVQEGGGPAKEIIEKLGLSIKDTNGNIKDTDALLLEVSGKLQGLSQGEKMNVLDKLGIDQSLLQTLSLSSEELSKLTDQAKSFGLVTQEQADAAAAYNDSLTTLRFAMQSIRQQVAVGFAPAMTDLTDRFVTFISTNHELIEGGLKYLGEVLVSTTGFLQRMAPFILGVAAAFTVAWLATGGFATVLGLVLSPVVLITAAIIALLLIVDDLITAFQGGQSVIADFFMEFFGVDIVPVLQGVVAAFSSMIDGILALISTLFDAWKQFSAAIVQVFTGDWEGALSSLLGAFNSLGEAIRMIFVGIFGFLADSIGQILSGLKSSATSLLPDWAARLINSGDADGAPTLSPNDAMAIGGTSSSSSTSNIEQNVQVNVTSSDPKAAGAAVGDALQDQLKTAKTQVNRGGR